MDEHGPFEDAFPIKNGDIPIAMLVYQGVLYFDLAGLLHSLKLTICPEDKWLQD